MAKLVQAPYQLCGVTDMGILVLTRRASEVLIIGDDIKITILSIKGNQVRIGVDAPKNIPVHREEIYQRIQAENIDAAN